MTLTFPGFTKVTIKSDDTNFGSWFLDPDKPDNDRHMRTAIANDLDEIRSHENDPVYVIVTPPTGAAHRLTRQEEIDFLRALG